jgi:hypothetical protein
MSQFIALRDAKPESIREYKQEVRAVVIDRAAFHVERALRAGQKPNAKRYQAHIEAALARAKLDVMAEIFQHMRELSRPRGVAGWTRGRGGLVRESRKPAQALALIDAYAQIVRYVTRLKAKGRPRKAN